MLRFCEEISVLIFVHVVTKQKGPMPFVYKNEKSGDVLISREVTLRVSSALRSLTTVFGMGTGGSSSLLSPQMAECQPHMAVPSKLNNITKNLKPSGQVIDLLVSIS